MNYENKQPHPNDFQTRMTRKYVVLKRGSGVLSCLAF